MDNTSNMFIWNKEEFTELVNIREAYQIKKSKLNSEDRDRGTEIILMCQWKKKAGLNSNLFNPDLSFFMSIGNNNDDLLHNKKVIDVEYTDSNIINIDLRNIGANEYIDMAIRSPNGITIIQQNTKIKKTSGTKNQDNQNSGKKIINYLSEEEIDNNIFIGPYIVYSQLVWDSIKLSAGYKKMELLFNYTGLVKQYNMAETIFIPGDNSISPEIMSKLLNPHNYHFLSCFLANHLFDNYIVPTSQDASFRSYSNEYINVKMSSTINTVKKSKIESIISKSNDKIIYKIETPLSLDQSFCNISLYYSLPSLYELSEYLFSLLKSHFKSQFIILKEEIFILQDSLDYIIKSLSDDSSHSLSSLSSLLSHKTKISSFIKHTTSHLTPDF